jgi:hypothetical protein
MRTSVSILAVLFTLVAATPRADAQETHAAPQAALDAALQQHVSKSTTDRDAVVRLLEREEVRQIAAQAGLDLRRAQTAVATLEGAELAQLATQARQAEQSLTGGASTVTISTTAIIIGLLILILIVVAA